MKLAARFLLACLAAMLMSGIVLGLARAGLGIELGFLSPLLVHHGAIMVAVVFASLITLERAVALQSWLLVLSAALGVVSYVCFVMAQPLVAKCLLLGASLGPSIALSALWIRKRDFYYLILACGALCMLLANLYWLAFNVPESTGYSGLVPLWMGFFVLTIFGERLEIGRVIMGPVLPAKNLVVASLMLILAGGITGRAYLSGPGLLILGAWILRFDIATVTIKKTALPKFIAFNVLVAAGWMMVCGLGLISFTLTPGDLIYDACLHALFLGFVMTMVFAHAPIILPSLTGLQIPWTPWLYLPSLLMQATLITRIAGDFMQDPQMRITAGLGHLVALMSYPIIAVIFSLRKQSA